MALAKDDWDQHWEQYAESAERNPAQLYRRRLVLARLRGAPKHLLDIGSGQGDLAAQLVLTFPGARVVGVEGSRSGVRVAESKVPQASFIIRNLLDSGQGPSAYAEWATDAVCSEVLEHVDDPVTLLRNSQAYMRPGCRLVVTVPGGPMSAFDHHIGHRKHYRDRELRAVLEDAGFVVDDVAAAGFPFFNLYRVVVIGRGSRLIADVESGEASGASSVARLVMKLFRLIFRFNLPASPWGWQLVATAHLPETD